MSGIKNDTQETIAIKIIQLNQINTPRKSQLLDCEIEGLKTIGHPNVVHIYSITQDADYIYIAMEYYPNGTLRDYIKKRSTHLSIQGAFQRKRPLDFFKKLLRAIVKS